MEYERELRLSGRTRLLGRIKGKHSHLEEPAARRGHRADRELGTRFWDKPASFFKRKDASNWTLTGLTFLIVVVAITTTLFQSRQISIYEQSMRADLRAYFAVTIDMKVFEVGKPYVVVIEFRNVGKTPAYNIGFGGRMRMGTGVYKFDIDSMETSALRTTQTLSPGQVYYQTFVTSPRVYTVRDSLDIFSGEFKMNFVGTYLYADRFGEEHYVHLCCWYNPLTRAFSYYDFYNDAN